MRVNWRQIHAAANSFAALSAACEQEGFIFHQVDKPADDVTCYSLNSLNESRTGMRFLLQQALLSSVVLTLRPVPGSSGICRLCDRW